MEVWKLSLLLHIYAGFPISPKICVTLQYLMIQRLILNLDIIFCLARSCKLCNYTSQPQNNRFRQFHHKNYRFTAHYLVPTRRLANKAPIHNEQLTEYGSTNTLIHEFMNLGIDFINSKSQVIIRDNLFT